MKTLKWPPDGRRVAFTEHKYENEAWTDECQGVANDGNYWYFTQDTKLWISLGKKMIYQQIPKEMQKLGFNHMGDLDYYKGKLYVPLEGERYPPRILIYRTQGPKAPIYLSSAELTHFKTKEEIVPNKYSPWCAINPKNRLLYTSEFSTKFVYVYKVTITASEKLELQPLGNFSLFNKRGESIGLPRIQGGVFSPNTGHLYLVCDTKWGGIMGFDMITGRLAFQKGVNYDPREKGLQHEELEGIDFCNTPFGQIHLIMLQNEEGIGVTADDDVYFKHYKVEDGTENHV